jgi:hypothetical protein
MAASIQLVTLVNEQRAIATSKQSQVAVMSERNQGNLRITINGLRYHGCNAIFEGNTREDDFGACCCALRLQVLRAAHAPP